MEKQIENENGEENLLDNLTLMTMNQLEILTGRAYRTIEKKLIDYPPDQMRGKAKLYIPKNVLPLIFDVSESGGKTGLERERIKFTQIKSEKEKLLLEKLKGKLIDLESVRIAWERVLSVFRAKLQIIPGRLAEILFSCESSTEIEDQLRTALYESLEELSNTNESEFTEGDPELFEDSETTGEDND